MSVLDSSIISTTASIQTTGGGSIYESNYGMPVLPPSNRVKVAIRLRPPFPEEGVESCVYIPPAPPGPVSSTSSSPPRPHNLQLELSPGKALEFGFDAVFGPSTTNSELYDEVAGPIVDGVLKGVNGTVLAYGQTGSGKTYSLGILTRVTGESGIVPRSLSHIFGAIGGGGTTTYSITMSFLQVYLDSVLDLLAPGSASSPPPPGVSPPTRGGDTTLNASFLTTGGGGGGGRGGANSSSMLNTTNSSNTTNSGSGGGGGAHTLGPSLPVREDPMRGFYVEGLTEYTVPSFTEAVALLNWGLENRVLGATRMNATSSRSHTMLIVRVEARTPVSLPSSSAAGTPTPAAAAAAGTGAAGFRTRRSQLMLCDLAGSERVRRTSSRGARLDEARAINASLHTLGQVISALAAVAAVAAGSSNGRNSHHHHHPLPHVPWRDNKLTRLLYGNVGGGANTYLLATLGPAHINASESASTLAFASRCMRVSAHPVASPTTSTQSDYAAMVAVLQGKLAGLEAAHASHVGAIVQRYESALGSLAVEVSAARRGAAAAGQGGGGGLGSPSTPLPSPTSGGGGGGAGDVSMISTVSSILTAGAGGGAATGGSSGGAPSSKSGTTSGSKGVTFFSPSASSTLSSSSPTTPPLHRPSLQDLLALHKPLYTHLVALYEASAKALLENTARGERYAVAWLKAIEAAQGDTGGGGGGGGGGVPVGGVASILKKTGGGGAGGASAASSGRNAAAAMHAVHSLHASNSIPLLTRQQHQHKKTSSPKSRGGSSSSGRKSGGSGGISVDGDDDEEEDDENEEGDDEEEVMVAMGGGGLNCSPSSSTGKKSPSSSPPSSPNHAQNSTRAAAAKAAALLGPPALPSTARPGERYPYSHPPLPSFPTFEAFLGQCSALSAAAATNTARLERLLEVKDGQFDEVKKQLAAAETAVRMRDEDVQSQRYVLRYLVDSTASLREELRRLKGRSGASAIGAAAYAAASSAAGGGGGMGGIGERGEEYSGGGDGGGGGGFDSGGGVDISISPPLSSSSSPPSPTLSSTTTTATTKLSVHFAPTPTSSAFSSMIPTITASSPLLPSPPHPAAPVPTILGGSIIPSPEPAAKDTAAAAAAATSAADGALEEVECIVDRRVVEGGKVLLKVHWRGSGVDEDEWFSREDLLLDFPLAVKQFEEGGKK